MEELARSFLFLPQIGQPVNENVKQSFLDQVKSIPSPTSSSIDSSVPLRELKYSLVDQYCKDLLASLYTFSLRTQMVRTTDNLKNLLKSVSQSHKLLFRVGKPPPPPVSQSLRK